MKKEIYKVQISIFGGPSVLIYNKDRTERYETANPKEIKAIQDFIGRGKVKAFVSGYFNEDGQIVMNSVIPNNISKHYRW